MICVRRVLQLLFIGNALFSGFITAASNQDKPVSAAVNPQRDLTLQKRVCIDESACPSLSTEFVSTTNKKLGGTNTEPRFQIAQAVVGNVITDSIWRHEITAPYDYCVTSAAGSRCWNVGTVRLTAKITLNGDVQRVSMTIKVIDGPTIKPTLYRRCVDTNGRSPFNTTCGEQDATAPNYQNSFDKTTNYEASDPGPYHYIFKWSWSVDGSPGVVSPAAIRSATFACKDDICKFQ